MALIWLETYKLKHTNKHRHTQIRTHPDFRTIILKGSGCVLQTVGDGSTGRLVGTRQNDIPVQQAAVQSLLCNCQIMFQCFCLSPHLCAHLCSVSAKPWTCYSCFCCQTMEQLWMVTQSISTTYYFSCCCWISNFKIEMWRHKNTIQYI